ncbi:unnamed protein product, partial [Prorocentrum cordatum]
MLNSAFDVYGYQVLRIHLLVPSVFQAMEYREWACAHPQGAVFAKEPSWKDHVAAGRSCADLTSGFCNLSMWLSSRWIAPPEAPPKRGTVEQGTGQSTGEPDECVIIAADKERDK